MTKKILVTGGTGFIGSHTVVALIAKGYQVVIADNLTNSKEEVLEAIRQITNVRPIFEKVDLSEEAACASLFLKHRDLYAVIHFAAAKAVEESVQKPLHYYKNNLQSLLNVLEGMRKIGCGRLVFSSSCTVYGEPDILPVTEEAPYKPALSPYGNTKQIAEEILKDLARASELQKEPSLDWKLILLRYFNPIGAHESGLMGELPNGVPQNLMPYITQTAVGVRSELSVYGSDYNTPDGTPVRDYIHVCDLAEAHVCAMEYMGEEGFKGWDAFNLGCGKGWGVLDVIRSFEKVSGVKLKYKIVGRREGDVEKVWGNVDKACTKLGWKAKRSLDEMTLSAWEWQKYLQKRV